MNRLFWIIVSAWFAFSLQACSGSSSSSNEEFNPDEEYDDEYDDPNSSGSGSSRHGDKNSSAVVQRDSLGRPISSAADPDKPGEPGKPGTSSSSTGAVVGIQDTVIADTTVVVDVESLPECTADNEGESFLVKSENVLYFCLAKEWVPSEEVSKTTGISCRDGMMYTGAEDEDDDKGSSTGGNTSPWGFGGGGTTVNTAAVDTAEPRIVGARLVGVAEKGPFRYGTSVKLIELDSTQHLADSKRTHKTCILNGDGNYSFDSVDYVSPYLRVKANGYYRNELTGGLSSKPVTLEAVVDVTEKDSVNVNILTHMEAGRVLKLVENSGNNQPIRAVKAQALREILSSFEIQWDKTSSSGSTGGGNFPGWGFGQQQQTLTTDGRFAEDIGLFDGDEYSGALLAISIMMLRKGTGSEMASYTAGIADRIKGNGNWDDNNAKADLADWLMVLDTSGSYATIRNNIASWNMGEVPDFEKHLKRFWSRAYNFGDCNAQKADTVYCISNSLSAYFCGGGYDQPGPTVRFICDANTHEWRVATAVEKDTYGYGKGTYPGQIRNGRVNKEAYYVYDDDSGKWRAATSDDIQEFEDIEDVYKSLKSGEKVIFFLRHAKRSDDTGKNGHLTDEGIAQSKSVGEKLKGENIYFANSNYTRSYETCDNIAIGAGMSGADKNTMDALDGEWYVKDNNKLEQYKNNNGGGWVVASEYAYKGSYSDAYYSLDTYSENFIDEIIKPEFSKVKKVGVFISHDMFVVPLTAYFTDKKVNLRYFDTKQWINYLAGLAIIMGSDGKIRYVPVRGLESGSMTM